MRSHPPIIATAALSLAGCAAVDGFLGEEGDPCWRSGACLSEPISVTAVPRPAGGIVTLETGDFDGDGYVDVVAAGDGTYEMEVEAHILFGGEEMTFVDRESLREEPGALSGIAAGAFHADCASPCLAWGTWDTELSGDSRDSLSLHVAKVGSDRTPSELFEVAPGVFGAGHGCWDVECIGPAPLRLLPEDEKDDLALISTEHLLLAQSEDTYAFTSIERPLDNSDMTRLEVGDLDSDGRPDLVVALRDPSGSGEVAVISSDEQGSFSEERFPVDRLAAAHPFGGDIVVARRCEEDCPTPFRALERVGASGVFREETTLDASVFLPRAMAVGDLDGDGAEDLLIGGEGKTERGEFHLLAVRGDGDGGLTEDILLADLDAPVTSVELAELDEQPGREILAGSEDRIFLLEVR